MIANIVLGMLLAWFVCVLVITIRAGAERREHEAQVARQSPRRRNAAEANMTPALAVVDAGAIPVEAPEVAPVSVTA